MLKLKLLCPKSGKFNSFLLCLHFHGYRGSNHLTKDTSIFCLQLNHMRSLVSRYNRYYVVVFTVELKFYLLLLTVVFPFQVPSTEIDKSTQNFFTHWDPDSKMFTVSLCALGRLLHFLIAVLWKNFRLWIGLS